MLPLWLLAAHMVGDFIFSTRYQAAEKFGSADARTRHVVGYCVPFVPVFLAYAAWDRALAGLAVLFALHWLTDSRRFLSTLGDVVTWRLLRTEQQRWDEADSLGLLREGGLPLPSMPPENPWPPIALFIDQGLHVVQLALVGTLFLS